MELSNLNRRHKAGLLLVLAGAGLCLFLDASAKQTAGAVLLGLAGTWLLGSLNLRTLWFLSSLLLFAVGLSIAAAPVRTDWNSYQVSVQDYDAAIADLRQSVEKSVPIKWDDVPPETGKSNTSGRKFDPDAFHQQWLQSHQQERSASKMLPSDFFDKSPADQYAYLSRVDSDFAKATPADQQAYVQFLTKTAKSSTRTVEIPESVRKWEGPSEREGDWETISIPFPGNMSDEHIIQEFETKVLVRPSFSLWSSAKSHRATSLSGVALAICGLIGCGWIIYRRRRMAS